jgi:hypothetical protein
VKAVIEGGVKYIVDQSSLAHAKFGVGLNSLNGQKYISFN